MIFKLHVLVALATIFQVTTVLGDDDWWKSMQLYQIYPRSFKDSDGDGIGDIKGITEKLSHLKEIGVKATWLSPIFPSPMKDFGYDISDYLSIDTVYGTTEDLLKLIEEANKIGIKILLDFVPNHTSDQSEWFKKSMSNDTEYRDYYVWHPGKLTSNPKERPLPPSNWISVFRGSAWEWSEVRKEYYLHQFMKEQPDLNYRNPKVVEAMKNVLRFWLEKGISGFRVDAIPHLIEAEVDVDGNYPDEPLSDLTTDKDDYNYLLHTKTRERDETYNIVYQWRAVLDEFAKENNTDTKVLLMEAMSDIDLVMKYYGNGTHEGAHFPFNFNLAFLGKDANATKLKEEIDVWFNKLPKGRVTNWVVGNHDQPRVATRFGPERSDGVIMMAMLLPGVAVTYQGEEIAMVNNYLSWEETQDPQACASGEERFNLTSRDPERTPFLWDNSTSAGFSTNDTTWLPVSENYIDMCVDTQNLLSRSALKMYKQLSDMRSFEAIKSGGLETQALNDDEVFAFSRKGDSDSIVVVINTGSNSSIVDLQKAFKGVKPVVEVVVSSVKSTRNVGDQLPSDSITLEAYEALVLMSGASVYTASKLLFTIITIFAVFKMY